MPPNGHLSPRQEDKALSHNATRREVMNYVSHAVNTALAANLGDESPLIAALNVLMARVAHLETLGGVATTPPIEGDKSPETRESIPDSPSVPMGEPEL